MRKRIEFIDMAKGIGILLVVIGHMLRGFTSAGMYEEYDNVLKYIDFTIYSFHMPLFFIISGILYERKAKILSFNDYVKFIKKKLKILMVPYFIFSWLQIIVKLAMSQSVNYKVNLSDFITIVFNPIEQFWFLYALMIIFLLISFLKLRVSSEKCKFLIILISFILSITMLKNTGILGIALNNSIYFYFGTIIFKKINFKNINSVKNILGISIIAYGTLNFFVYLKFLNFSYITKVLMALIGSVLILGTCKIFDNKVNVITDLLKLVGRNSMPIYLLHTIFGSGIRIILIKLSINNLFIQSVFGIIFAIAIPMSMNYLYVKMFRMKKITLSSN